jgi:hypothetical protein
MCVLDWGCKNTLETQLETQLFSQQTLCPASAETSMPQRSAVSG